MEQLGSHWTDFRKRFIFEGFFFENAEIIQVSLKYDITGTLHEDMCALMITGLILPRMRKISDKSFREIQNVFYVQ